MFEHKLFFWWPHFLTLFSLESSNLTHIFSCPQWQQVRPAFPEDTPQELASIVQSCWVEDPAMRPSFSQIIRMLDAFLTTIPPPPPSEQDEDTTESEDTTSSLSSKSSSVSSIVSRATSKLSVVRHLFASKKGGSNGKAWSAPADHAPETFFLGAVKVLA